MGRARHIGLFGNPKSTDFAAADEAVARVGARGLAERNVSTLSDGERQLVMIVRALAGKSGIFILDEPALAPDLKNQRLVLDLTKDLAHGDSLAVVFSTHLPGQAFDAADRAMLMQLQSEHLRSMGKMPEALNEASLMESYDTTAKVPEAKSERGEALRAAVAEPQYTLTTPVEDAAGPDSGRFR